MTHVNAFILTHTREKSGRLPLLSPLPTQITLKLQSVCLWPYQTPTLTGCKSVLYDSLTILRLLTA